MRRKIKQNGNEKFLAYRSVYNASKGCHPERRRGIFAPNSCTAPMIMRRFFDSLRSLRMTRLWGLYRIEQRVKLDFTILKRKRGSVGASFGAYLRFLLTEGLGGAFRGIGFLPAGFGGGV